MNRPQNEHVFLGFLTLLTTLIIIIVQRNFQIPILFMPICGISTGFILAKGLKKFNLVLSIFFVAALLIQHFSFNQLSLYSNILTCLFTTTSVGFMLWVSRKIYDYFMQDSESSLSANTIKSFVAVIFIAPIVPSIVGPISYVMNFNYPINVIHLSILRFYIGGVLGFTIFAPFVYVILISKINSQQRMTYGLFLLLIVLFSSMLFTIIEVNNKLTIENKFSTFSEEFTHQLLAKLEEKVIATNLIKNKYFKKIYYSKSKSGDAETLNELLEMSVNTDSIVGFALFDDKGSEFSLLESIPENIPKMKIAKYVSIKNFKRVSKEDFSYTPVVTLASLGGSKELTYIGFRSFSPAGKRIFGSIIDLNNMLKNEVLSSLSNVKYYDIKLQLAGNFDPRNSWVTVLDQLGLGTSAVKRINPYSYYAKFSHWGLDFKFLVSAPKALWFAFTSIQHWVLQVIFTICVMLVNLIVLLMLFKDMRLRDTLGKLKTEVISKEQYQKKLSSLNQNLEKQVHIRSEQLMNNIKEKEMLLKLFPDHQYKLDKQGNILNYYLGDQYKKEIIKNEFKYTNVNQYIEPNYVKRYLEIISKAIETDETQTFNHKLVYLGEMNYYEARVVKFDENSVVVYVRNVTEKKLLETKVADQNMRALTSAKLASLGEMAGGIAHEINNPLSIIDGSAQLVTAMIERGDLRTDKAVEHLGRIHNTVQRIAKIINGLKKFTRNSNDFALVDMDLFCEEIFSFCHERFKINGIKLDVTNRLINKRVYCNQVELSQVIINLLNNAFDAVSGATPIDKWVKVELVELKNIVHINVMDSGQGVPRKIRNEIMSPFFTTKKVGSGTGLGLSISRTIIENHNGDLELVENSEYTCFRVSLPKVLLNQASNSTLGV